MKRIYPNPLPPNETLMVTYQLNTPTDRYGAEVGYGVPSPHTNGRVAYRRWGGGGGGRGGTLGFPTPSLSSPLP